MNTLNRKDLVEAIALECGLSKTDVNTVLVKLIDKIGEHLANGDEVTLSGLAKFYSREQGPRTYRHPQTGEELRSEAKRVPAIKPLKGLKDRVNG